MLPVSLTPCASGLLCGDGRPFAFPRPPWGLLTAPAAGRKPRRHGAGLLRSLLWRPSGWESALSGHRPPHGPRGRNAMGPEVGMGKTEGLALLSFTPGPGALNLRDLESQGACGLPEVMCKMRLCTNFCSDKSKCPGLTPSGCFILVPSLSRSCAWKHNTAAVISSRFHCCRSLVNPALRVKRSWWLTRLKNTL